MDAQLRKQLFLMLRALYICIEEKWSEVGRRYDVTPAQQHVLHVLSTSAKPLPMKEIGRLGCWHASTVTRILRPLQEKGHIVVERDPQSPKHKLVSITESGARLFDGITTDMEQMETFPLDVRHLTEEDIQLCLQYGHSVLHVQKGSAFVQWLQEEEISG
ncbi:MarR family winged helix-turn-helix transcriptional regulator [Ectobacillus ponti]|uniref:MarR family transcriptional regulator n=1 Tax=Ectobacillus ponti TaxID=2961894 RepID=A0AA42BPG3_9BACI|nr:MarR family transcriptional regulator [Ectobacillus ponti]MCP8968396.1 MarR family transcriptional regulator [Ectobacillus ponti]